MLSVFLIAIRVDTMTSCIMAQSTVLQPSGPFRPNDDDGYPGTHPQWTQCIASFVGLSPIHDRPWRSLRAASYTMLGLGKVHHTRNGHFWVGRPRGGLHDKTVTSIPIRKNASPTRAMGRPPWDSKRIWRVRHFRTTVRHSGVYGRCRTQGQEFRVLLRRKAQISQSQSQGIQPKLIMTWSLLSLC